MLFLISMKTLRFLSIMVIGMMALTVTATTTAKLEQKQKTELVKEFSFQINDVIVVNEYQVASFQDVAIFKIFNEPKTVNTAFLDVGWRSSAQELTSIQYKEKLLENCNENLVYLTNKRARSIRSDC